MPIRPLALLAPLAVFLLGATGTALAAPRVVASIKPIHSLVATVMAGVGEPVLLVRGGASPHSYSLRPSDAEALQGADLVVWTGHGFELFLSGVLDTLAPEATVMELADTPGLELLPLREGGAFDAHGDEGHGDEGHGDDGHGDEGHGEVGHGDHAHPANADGADMHFWLDPANGRLLLLAIAETLAETDPDNGGRYRANAAAGAAELDALAARIEARLAPVRERPFLVFHDAYQYFEERFDVHAEGSVTLSPETAPGAQRLAELRARVRDAGVVCVFAEPQFEPALIAPIIEGTGARSGVLDPEGAGLPEGPGLYAALLEGLADDLLACLAP